MILYVELAAFICPEEHIKTSLVENYQNYLFVSSFYDCLLLSSNDKEINNYIRLF